MLKVTRIHAITTPKSCQGRKAAAIRDACGRRDLRVTFFCPFLGDRKRGVGGQSIGSDP